MIFGAVINPDMGEDVSITLIATGVGPKSARPSQTAAPLQQAAMAAAAVAPAASNRQPDYSSGMREAPEQQAPMPAPGSARVMGGAIGGPAGVNRTGGGRAGGVEIPSFLRKMRK